MKQYLTTVAVTIGAAIAAALLITALFGHPRHAAPSRQAAVEQSK